MANCKEVSQRLYLKDQLDKDKVMSPPGEYDESIPAAAAMRSHAIIALATCLFETAKAAVKFTALT